MTRDMHASRFVVGIDLGTTNCAVAYAEIRDADGAGTAGADATSTAIRVFPIPQVVAPGQVEPLPALPSFLLLPSPREVPAAHMALPWDDAPGFAVGAMARDRGAELPHRLVSSAKSWLSHTGVDRAADILPWRGAAQADAAARGDGDGAGRVSPVAASARYLAHIRAAWDAAFPGAPLAEQDLYLTVPASFDAVARELTVRAADMAGLGRAALLEEPQAAFYAYLDARGDAWREDIAPGDAVLVCDIGGGTTDFTLIAAADDGAGNLALERVAVGDHILCGGDNMDLALAHAVIRKLGDKAKKLKPMQQRALVHACRRGKEALLAQSAGDGAKNSAADSAPIAILGAGSRLIGGTIRTELLRAEVEALVGDGFFPRCRPGDQPRATRAVGLVELGLPYAQDPGITRHLAAFLSRHGARHGRAPSAVLYNGGVMKGELLRRRVSEIVASWQDPATGPLRALPAADTDTAVARGAAYYGLVRRGRGIRIRGGTARAYYIGVEAAMPAIPGFTPPVQALCVAPAGMEEGARADVPGERLGLVVGEPATFRLFASSARAGDAVGAVVDPDDAELTELDPVETVIGGADAAGQGAGGAGRAGRAGEVVAVALQAHVTEVGTLELWCVAGDGRRFELEYSIRERDPDLR